jgi:hypothetical protein
MPVDYFPVLYVYGFFRSGTLKLFPAHPKNMKNMKMYDFSEKCDICFPLWAGTLNIQQPHTPLKDKRAILKLDFYLAIPIHL